MRVRTRNLFLRHGPSTGLALAFAGWLWSAHSAKLAIAMLVAAVLTWIFIPPLGRFLRRRRIVVRPGGRSAHRGSVPQMGGLAVYAPFAAVATLMALNGGVQMGGLLLGASLLLAVGLYDDLKGCSPRTKVTAQVLGACILVLTGTRLDSLGIPGLGTIELGPAAIPVTVFWVVLATNAFNLIDGMDGIAAGVAVVALVGLVYLNVAAALAALVVGSLLGFLPHNLPRARIFLGDSGTMFLGFVLAALLMLLPTRANLPLAVGLFAYPLGDLGLAVTRRFVRGKPLFHGDKSHIHHKLRDHLRSDHVSIAAVWMLASVAAVIGIWMQDLRFLLLMGLFWAATAYGLVLWGRVRLRRMIVNRRPFQELHLLRQFVVGKLRLARTQDEVRQALRRFVEDSGLVSVHVGGLSIGTETPAGDDLKREEVRLQRGRATWSWPGAVPGAEEPALVADRRAVVHDVLRLADRRLRAIRVTEATES